MKQERKKWTVFDDTILRSEYPKRPAAEVAQMLGRSKQATVVRASLLGLKKDHYGIKWTADMEKRVRDFYPIMFSRPLAKWLGVSHRSLIRKARELGVEKQDGFLEKRRNDIEHLASEGRKRSTKTGGRFQKGNHYGRQFEFQKGHTESEESKAKRSVAMQDYWRRRKARQNMLSSIGLTEKTTQI